MARLSRRRGLTLASLLALALAVPAASAHSAPSESQTTHHPPAASTSWVGSWAAAPSHGEGGQTGYPGRTFRNVVHLSIGGSAIRVKFSNAFGTTPLPLASATVALAADPGAPTAVRGTMRQLTFGGADEVLIPPGAEVLSDPVNLRVRDGADLLVSTYVAEPAGPVTSHRFAWTTSFYADGGDYTARESGSAFTGTTDAWFYVTEVVVKNPQARGAVVTLGDSITDGSESTFGANGRWPDLLGERLRRHGIQMGVLNAGLVGNRLLMDSQHPEGIFGVNALSRFDRDVLARAGVRSVIVLLGINDIQQEPHQTDPARITFALSQLDARANAVGVRTVCATLMPFNGWDSYTEELEVTRQGVNAAIRRGLCDSVVDFDAVVRDPADPTRMRAEYDSGDGLHPNDAGMRAMAQAVPLHAL